MMKAEAVLEQLRSLGSADVLTRLDGFAIRPERAYGVSIPVLRKIARDIGRDHALAQELWSSGVHEARHIATLIEDPVQVTEEQMERWAKDFDSWSIVDGCCGNLFDKTPFAYAKVVEWSCRPEEYVKRAAFVLMATLSVHDKGAEDEEFLKFLPIIKRESTDERNFVRKAVNWALRQIGKRNLRLNEAAVSTAREINMIDSRGARWIASDTLRELTGDWVKARLLR